METAQELSFVSTLLSFTAVIFIIAIGVILLNQHFRKNLYRQKLEKEELNALHQRKLLSASIHIQEVERKRIAGNLHDELGAVLSIARMHLIQLEEDQTSESMNPALQNIRNLTESALASIRRISHELMPPQLEMFGIIKTLEAIANRTNQSNGIHIAIDGDQDLPTLPWAIQLGIYRISLELISNTIKHASASEILICLKERNTFLQFQYHDNGIGIPPIPPAGGLGLKNIEARVSSMKGIFESYPTKLGGFSLHLRIPITIDG